MQINSINSCQNISSKAKISLLADKNLLPTSAVPQLIEKVKTVGKPNDVIHAVVQKRSGGDTVIHAAFLRYPSDRFTHHIVNTVKGSFREKQKQTLNVITNYIEYLKKEYEK